MSSDELKAWLLLAGFKRQHNKKRYRYLNRYTNYIIVKFLMAGRIEVRQFEKRRRFIRRKTAQQYIHRLIRPELHDDL